MIINYSYKGNQIVDYLKNTISGTEIFRKDGDKARKFFSVTPYVFVFDYDRMQNDNFLKLFADEQFSGSKILYCLFISEKFNENCLSYSIRIARQKRLVLFGCTCVNTAISQHTQQQLTKITDKIIDYRPFEVKNGVTFPICR